MRKMISIVLALVLLLALPLPARAANNAQIEAYAQSLIQYYRHHQKEAENNIWDILQKMKALDPQQAAVWEKIMEDWRWINSDMPIYEEVLPDGLPQDDSLCIVVMGFGLKEDGTMKEELIDRLVVALSSAIKYPNAWVCVTGGQTSEVKGATEAGQMAAWLQEKGVEKSRLIVEKQSLSTTANAVNVYKLLNGSYPQVDSIALISSDYHLTWSCAMFTTVSHYKSGYEGGREIKLVGNAVCNTGATADTLNSQAWGISLIAGLEYNENEPAPVLYYVERPTEPVTEPTDVIVEEEENLLPFREPVRQEVQEEPQEEASAPSPVLLLAPVLLVIFYILMPKKPRKKRKKPEWKWDV